jgi:hypothetical protein
VLLKLAEKFQIDLNTLAGDDDERLNAALMEAFSDPIFDAADVKASDIKDVAATIPAFGRAVLDLYNAYKRGPAAGGTLSTGDDSGEAGSIAIPSEEVTEFLQKRMNHFPDLEEAAEQLWVDNGLAIHTLQQDLMQLLATRYAVDVDIAPAEAMDGAMRRYNPLTRRLELSELLPISSRTFQLGVQIAYLGFRKELDQLIGGLRRDVAIPALSRSRALHPLRSHRAPAPLRQVVRAGLPPPHYPAPQGSGRVAVPSDPRRYRGQYLEAFFGLGHPDGAFRLGLPALECL